MTAEELKAWRLRIGLTQSEAAAALKVALSTYRQWEQDRGRPHPLLDLACRQLATDHTPEAKTDAA